MLLALQDIGRAGTLPHVGFDASTMLIGALRDGHLEGLVLQNPVRMGYLGVMTVVQHVQGQTVEKRVDTGVMMVTRENMESPEAQELLNPALETAGT
jgi:ribose transport system substrate-binding protein